MHETANFREDPFTGKYMNTSINFTRSKAKLKKKKLSRHIRLVEAFYLALIKMIAECSLPSEGYRDFSICLTSKYTPKHFFFPCSSF